MSAPAGSRRTAWLAGLTAGALGGLLALELPVIGYAILVAFAGPALVVGPRRAALGGLLLGAGALALLLLGRADLACAEFNEGVGQGCVAPDLTPWRVVGGASVMIGLILTVSGAVRRPGNAP